MSRKLKPVPGLLLWCLQISGDSNMSPLAVYSLLVIVCVAGAARADPDAKGYIVFCPCMGKCDHK